MPRLISEDEIYKAALKLWMEDFATDMDHAASLAIQLGAAVEDAIVEANDEERRTVTNDGRRVP